MCRFSLTHTLQMCALQTFAPSHKGGQDFFFLYMKFNGKILLLHTHTHMHAHEVCQQLQDRGLNVTVCWAD